MRWKSEHTAAAALILALGLPTGIFVAARRLSRQLQISDYWVLHSGEVEENLAKFQTSLAEAAIAAREYVIAGDTASRLRFDALEAKPGALIDTLRHSTIDNPTQRPSLDQLAVAADEGLGRMRQAVELRQAGHGEAARAVLDSAAMFSAYVAIQTAAKRVDDKEQLLLRDRRASLAVLSRHWNQGFYSALGLSFLLLVGGFTLLVAEVRRRRLAEEALALERHQLDVSLQRFERMADNVPAVVWTCREDGSLEYVSHRIEAAMQWAPAEARAIAGHYLSGWFAEEDTRAIAEALRRLFGDGEDVGLDARILSGEGRWQWVHVSARRVQRPDGTLMADGLLVDQTERRRQIESDISVRTQAESNRFRSEFLSTLSHELRTPLTAILGFSDLLLRESDADMSPDARTLAEQIRCAGRDLLALTNDVLDWGKIEAGQLRLDAGEIPLEWPLTEVADLLTPIFTLKNLRLVRHLDAGAVVWADRTRVRQILLNLIGNAVKFSPPGGVIEVASRQEGGALRIEVRDHGIGIPPAEQAIIFERYRQGSGGVSVGGTGLGLALVKQLVAQHGGEVWVASEPGEGSTFGFSLPLAGVAVAAG